MDEHEQQAALLALARYWRAHPHAADTLDGIRTWWIPDIAITAPELAQLLAWLESRQMVVALAAADGRVRYALADPGRHGLQLER